MDAVDVQVANSVAAAEVSRLGVERKRPREAVLACEMLAEGKGYDEIREATGLGFTAITGLRSRHEEVIEVRRRQLAADGFEMAEGARLLVKKRMEMLADDEDQLKKTNIKDITLAYAVLQDKGLQALGEARTIVEHRAGRPSIEDALAAIKEARKSVQEGSVEIETKAIQ